MEVGRRGRRENGNRGDEDEGREVGAGRRRGKERGGEGYKKRVEAGRR